MEKKLTELEAFQAMIKFLDIYYQNTFSDDIGSLLGDMNLDNFFKNGTTADPAAWEDWIECINAVLKKTKNENNQKE
jgi:hypothetical protein